MANESNLRAAILATGLVTPSQLDYALRLGRHRLAAEGKRPGSSVPDRLLSEILVEQSVLTPYQSEQLLAGRTKLNLGPYLITDWIGQGGMGQVFKAVHQVMGRECAIKVLPLSRANEEARQSFAREIRMQAQLDCSYLVRAYDAGQDGSVHYLVTEFVPGMDLRRLVRTHGPLGIHQAASIIRQAALGLEYAHCRGMVHRDIKPGNILVTPDGIAKVSDIGLAGFAAELFDDPRAGKIVGTADYLSPEQIRTPLQVGPTSDIYSLGCTLYYVICGKPPFPGGDTKSKIRRHLDETPWHPRRFVPNISEEFVDIVADMMEKESQHRIQTAAEVAVRLEPWAGDAGQLTTDRLARGPWLAPPFPSGEADVLSNPEGALDSSNASQESPSEGSSSATSEDPPAAMDFGSNPTLGASSTGTASVATLGGVASSSGLSVHRTSPGMLIAMTVAIVLPPAILIGAIIGFLVRQSMY